MTLFSPFQPAYRPGHSTETALLKARFVLFRLIKKHSFNLLCVLDLPNANIACKLGKKKKKKKEERFVTSDVGIFFSIVFVCRELF